MELIFLGFKVQKNKKKRVYKAADSRANHSTAYNETAEVSEEISSEMSSEVSSDSVSEVSSSDNFPITKTPAKKKKGTKLSNVLTSILIVIALGVFVFSLLQILTIMGEYKAGRDEYDRIAQGAVKTSTTGYLIIDYDNLLGINSDFKGWIDIPGTDISYPIVYSAQDNDFYLRTTFERKANASGSIFIDFRCDPTFVDPVTVIYGHHMRDGSMFNNIKLYLEKSFWQENQEVHIYTKNGIMIYDIFAAYTPHIEDECFAFEAANTEPTIFNSWINNVKSKSFYNTGITPTIDDRVILLSTCVSGGAGTEDYRHVVAAVLRETISNPTI